MASVPADFLCLISYTACFILFVSTEAVSRGEHPGIYDRASKIHV